MKLLSLNTYSAGQGQLFFDYIKDQALEADIFCLQEVFSAKEPAPKIYNGLSMYLMDELTLMLPGFQPFYEARSNGYAEDIMEKAPWPIAQGLAVFIKKGIEVKEHFAVPIDDSANSGGFPLEGIIKAQVLKLTKGAKEFFLVNFHGNSRPGTKLDTDPRIHQSKELIALLKSFHNTPFILCGDFNLNPDTQSIKMLDTEAKNLIKEFNIQNTRNELSWKRYDNKQYFADYTFISPNVNVKSFEVPYNLVSDHLPMILEFSL